VRLGQRTAGTVEVLEGLEVGEPVVREGIHRLRDGVSVRLPERPTGGAAPTQGEDA
jgi:membrane fusion protein (multidrug efflux system)